MKRKILIVEDNIGLSQMQKDWFEQAGYDAVTAMNEPIARTLIRKNRFDLVLSDVRLPEGDGISLLKWLKKEKMKIPFIITTEYVSVPDVVRTIKLGANDYLPKPVRREHLLELAEDIFRPIATRREQKKELLKRTCPKILEVERCARLVAPSDMSVLILGANGTGKESVAQSIHEDSDRSEMPFVAVNCGVLPRELAASMLFGHVKGAFTGADTAKEGFSTWRKAAPCFWTKSVHYLSRYSPCYSGYCRKTPIFPLAGTRSVLRMCALWPRQMRTWKRRFRRVGSGKIFTTV